MTPRHVGLARRRTPDSNEPRAFDLPPSSPTADPTDVQREVDEIAAARAKARNVAWLWVATAVDELRREAKPHRLVVRQLTADLRAGKLDGPRRRAKALAHAADELAKADRLEALADALAAELVGGSR